MKNKKNNGITLISLVITIIILLILAGVTINLTLGEHGIFRVAKDASLNYILAQENEDLQLSNLENELDQYTGGLNIRIEKKLEEINDNEYIRLVASVDGYSEDNLIEMSYEDFAMKILEGKNEEQKQQLMMEAIKYFLLSGPDEIDDIIIETNDFSEFTYLLTGTRIDTLDDYLEKHNEEATEEGWDTYNSIDEMLIKCGYVKPYMEYEENKIKELVIINPELELESTYYVENCGEYTFIAETWDGKKAIKTIEVTLEDFENSNIFTYTDDGYITGIKKRYFKNVNYGKNEVVKLANVGTNKLRIAAIAAAPELYLIDSLEGKISIPNEINGTKIIGISREAFRGIRNLLNVEIANGITYIGDYAFDECTSLREINIPESVTHLGSETFRCCPIKRLRIPNTVIEMENEVFVDWEESQIIDIDFYEDELPSTWSSDWYDRSNATVNFLKRNE